jgi:diguanylate cyclase (GGDEF)-like protein
VAEELTGQRAAAALRATPAPHVVLDADGRIRAANPAARRLLGLHPTGSPLLPDLFRHPQAVTAYLRQLRAAGAGRSVFFTGDAALPDGSATRTARITAHGVNLLTDPAVRGLLLSLADVTEHAEQVAALSRAALTDPLTGLANRALLTDRLRQHAAGGAVIVLDLDAFKAVNDTHGHAVGDHLLTALAGRLQRAVPPAATVARLGGDEFAVLLPGADVTAADACAHRLLAAIAAPVPLPGPDSPLVVVTAAAGVAAVRAADHPETALRAADAALYAAKAAGGGVRTADPTIRFTQRRGTDTVDVAALRRRNATLHREARTDPLTGLPNRRRLDEDLLALQADDVTARPGARYAVVFADIDRFGAYNKAHGDDGGDLALRRVAAALAGACRTGDVAYRKGGEEFVVLLPGTDLPAATTAADRLRAAVADLGLPHGGNPDAPQLTVSIGVAGSDLGTSQEVLAAAGRAMLRAKAAGRNQVHVATADDRLTLPAAPPAG